MLIAAMKLKDAYSLEEKLWPWEAETLFCQQSPSSQGYGFSSGHVWMRELDLQRKLSAEELMPLNCGVGEDSWESLVLQGDPVHPKGNQSWIFIERIGAEAILWLPDVKNWLTGKNPDAGKDWRQEEGMTEFEVVGWHRRLNGHEFE